MGDRVSLGNNSGGFTGRNTDLIRFHNCRICVVLGS